MFSFIIPEELSGKDGRNLPLSWRKAVPGKAISLRLTKSCYD